MELLLAIVALISCICIGRSEGKDRTPATVPDQSHIICLASELIGLNAWMPSLEAHISLLTVQGHADNTLYEFQTLRHR